MKKMSIYEPAMCCETGICGVSVDPELLRISTVVNSLNKNGIEVKRANLNSAPSEFVDNKVINDFVNKEGVEKLPAILLDDEVVMSGRYPSNAEFVELLSLPEGILNVTEERDVQTSSCGCCCEGGCC